MKKLVLLAGVCTLAAGCSSSSGGGAGGGTGGEATKSLTISGKIGGTLSVLNSFSEDIGVKPFASTYKVRCVTLSGPLAAGEDEVDTANENAFAVAMQTGLNAPLGCFLLKDTAIAAIFSFGQAQSMKQGAGNAQQTGYAPRPDSTTMDLGSITISGATASVAAITENGTEAAPTFNDMTGNWTLTSVYENEAENYFHPCVQEVDESELAACKANWGTAGFYIRMFKAKKTGLADRLGVALWEGPSSAVACGGKEGLNLETGWAIDTTYNSASANVTQAFPAVSFDWTNITSTELAKAPFVKSTEGGHNNCPKDDDHTTELPGCTTATTCNSFDWSAIADAETRSSEKVRCVMNSMVSGGNQAYNWGDTCGRRLGSEVWDMMYPGGGGSSPAMNTNGNGCNAANCGLTMPWEDAPNARVFFSELFVTGNVGTASESETETRQGLSGQDCDTVRTTAITMTQTSATTATFIVEQSTMKDPNGNDWDETKCTTGDTSIAQEVNKTFRFKLNFTKQ